MRKIVFFFFFVLIFCITFLTEAKGDIIYQGEEEVKVIIDFQEIIVTSKNLKEKLADMSYQLLSLKPKVKLTYQDETVVKKISSLNRPTVTTLEQDYETMLRKFGLTSELEKFFVYGVPLSEVTLLTKKKNLNVLQKFPYNIEILGV